MLARREHSRRELLRKLTARGFAAESVTPVLESLVEQHLQSDERYAEDYVRSRIERGFGPLRIVAELGERGVADGIARAVVCASDRAWNERARAACSKRFGDAAPETLRDKSRQLRFLAQRGFSQEQCQRAVERLDMSD